MSLSRPLSVGVLVCLPLAAGCANVNPVAPDAASSSSHFTVALRPQPEPPGSTWRFLVHLVEDDGEWFGTFGDGTSSCGVAELTDPTRSESGEVTHMAFALRLMTHDGTWQVNADLSGILNNVNGVLVLNGETTSGSIFGARVHQQGRIIDPGSGDPFSFLGELMLRPQPEPPGRVRGGPSYPPNPC